VRLRLFGGKGGAGKTTLAAAAALGRAEAGRRVLVVSTDPAHSLGDAFGHTLSPRPRRIATRRGRLHAVELDAERTLERWLARRRPALRAIALRGTLLERREIDRLLRLTLPGVDELMGLLEVMRLGAGHDEVVVDTAPTGHALRLLAAPALLGRLAAALDAMYAKHRFLSRHVRGDYTPDAADALIAELEEGAETLAARLRDPTQTELTWVTLAEILSIRETEAAVDRLAGLGIAVARVVVNQVIGADARGCRACAARRRAERAALAGLSPAVARRPLRLVHAFAREPHGLPRLRAVARALSSPHPSRPPHPPLSPRPSLPPSGGEGQGEGAPGWVAALAPPGTRLLLVLGKGGVGKTTCAATVALALAARGRGTGPVLLVSTDPAHSLGDVLGHPVGERPRAIPGAPPALRALEIDAEGGFARWRAAHRDALETVLGASGGRSGVRLAFEGDVARDLLELTPPGLDELWSVRALIGALFPPPGAAPRYRLAVVDTAPTGHALRMLAMPDTALRWARALLALLLKYQKILRPGALARDLLEIARDLRRFRALLRDAGATRAVVVSRPGHLPARETARLVASLRAARIGVSTLIMNAVPGGTGGACVRCATQARAPRSAPRPARHALVTPAVTPPPRGVPALTAWGRRWTRLAG
jgi:arsenite-transporting ATPase